jgi:hypothetical protein
MDGEAGLSLVQERLSKDIWTAKANDAIQQQAPAMPFSLQMITRNLHSNHRQRCRCPQYGLFTASTQSPLIAR